MSKQELRKRLEAAKEKMFMNETIDVYWQITSLDAIKKEK